MRLTVWVVACSLALAFSAQAQDDNLAPLVPTPKSKAKPKPKPKVKVQPKVQPKVAPRAEDEDLAPLVAAKADLLVKPPNGMTGAVLAIDGKDVGTLPLPAQSLSVGEHQVMVKRKAYAVFVKKVTLVAGKTVELQASMQPVSALLSVNSDVEAEVFVNGKLIGSTPIVDHELPASTIELAVRKEGYREDTQTLAVVAGREYPVAVHLRGGGTTSLVANTDAPVETSLTPTDSATGPGPVTVVDTAAPAPVYQRWYFWAGVAAVVAAGVTAGVVVGVTQKPVPLRSSEVCTYNGGKCDACLNFASCATSAALPWGPAQPVLHF